MASGLVADRCRARDARVTGGLPNASYAGFWERGHGPGTPRRTSCGSGFGYSPRSPVRAASARRSDAPLVTAPSDADETSAAYFAITPVV